MADEIKRLNYFTGQFLEAGDFSDEQSYHIGMRRRLTATLRGPGIMDGGFSVEVKNQATATKPALITVGAGCGVDNQGRELVILSTLVKEIPNSELSTLFKQTVAIYLGYREEETDNKIADLGVNGKTRFTEKPDIILQLATLPAPASLIRLANLAVDGAGNIAPADESVRQLSNVFIDGQVGVGTHAPNAKLEVVGGGGSSIDLRVNGRLQSNNNDGGLWISADRFIGGHSVNKVGFYNGGAWQLTVRNDGNVGIGTLDPQAKLDVDGGAFLGYETSISDFGAPLKSGFYQGCDQGTVPPAGDVPDLSHPWTHVIAARHSNSSNNHQLQIAATYTPNDRLYFRKIAGTGIDNPVWNEVATRGSNVFSGNQSFSAGNIGIGTLTPQQMLSVQSGLNVDQANANAGALQPGISFGSGSGEGISSRRVAGGVNPYGLDLYAGGAVRLSIANGGNVGFGTAIPTHPMHLKTDWSFLALDTNRAGQDSGLRLMEGGALKWHIYNSSANARFYIVREGLTASLTIDAQGKVGIGTGTSEQMLSVQSGLNVDQANANAGTLQPGISFGSGSGEGISSRRSSGVNQYGLDFYAGGTARLSITNAGSIGIGTKDAKRILHVEGNEIHSGGTGAGFSFSDRSAPAFLDQPTNGQRWVWFASNGSAQLWSGSNKLSVTPNGSLQVSSDIHWGNDHSNSGYVRIGNLQIAWGKGNFTSTIAEYSERVNFPISFLSAIPVVTVSINDPGYGANTLRGAAGAYQADKDHFLVLYKKGDSFPKTDAHNIEYSWIAIGPYA